MRPPDAAFADPRLAVLYDDLDGDHSDLDAYVAFAAEVGAQSVIDLGCGTGSLAVRLAALGLTVTGVDPASASLDVARTKPYAEQVTWLPGDATSLLGLDVAADLAVMTGNVAQVFVSDDDWHATLAAVHSSLRPGGWLVFETRRPEVRDWESWGGSRTVVLPDGRSADLWMAVTEVEPPLVTFTGTTTVDGVTLSSTSTLRFRSKPELERDLSGHGFEIADVREAPDRPGKEMVFLARRSTSIGG